LLALLFELADSFELALLSALLLFLLLEKADNFELTDYFEMFLRAGRFG
jgi:hypothetical protein